MGNLLKLLAEEERGQYPGLGLYGFPVTGLRNALNLQRNISLPPFPGIAQPNGISNLKMEFECQGEYVALVTSTEWLKEDKKDEA